MSTDIPSAAPSEADWNIVLIRRVSEALMDDAPEDFAKLDVTTIGTTVVLRGLLVGEAARDRAIEVARTTTGVGGVIDRITVRAAPPAPRAEVVTLTSRPAGDPWWQRATVPAFLLAVLAAIGAQQWSAAAAPDVPAPLAVVPVEGVALFDGRPAAGAKLTFHPLYAVGGVKERPTAIVGADGRFLVGTYAEADGAPAGPYVVTVEYRPQIAAGNAAAGNAAAGAAEVADRAPEAFRSRFTTPLKAHIPGDAPFVRLPPLHVVARGERKKG